MALGEQGQNEIAHVDKSNYSAPTQTHKDIAAQLSPNALPSHTSSPQKMPENTSPFEEGYALLKGGPAWEWTEMADAERYESIEDVEAICCVNTDR